MRTARITVTSRAGDMTLFYRTGGNPEGEAVLLIHGLGCNSDFWNGVMTDEALGRQAFFVAPDLPCHGRSEKPRWFSCSMTDFARMLERFCRDAGLDLKTVVGFSMGGPIAVHLADALKPARLVLAEPVLTGRDVPLSSLFSKMPLALLSLFRFLILSFPSASSRLHLSRPRPETVETVRRAFSQTPSWVFHRCCKELVRCATDPATYEKFKKSSAKKTVLLRGERRMPGFEPPEDLGQRARVVTIPHTGHVLMLDNPAAFNRELEKIVTD